MFLYPFTGNLSFLHNDYIERVPSFVVCVETKKRGERDKQPVILLIPKTESEATAAHVIVQFRFKHKNMKETEEKYEMQKEKIKNPFSSSLSFSSCVSFSATERWPKVAKEQKALSIIIAKKGREGRELWRKIWRGCRWSTRVTRGVLLLQQKLPVTLNSWNSNSSSTFAWRT